MEGEKNPKKAIINILKMIFFKKDSATMKQENDDFLFKDHADIKKYWKLKNMIAEMKNSI